MSRRYDVILAVKALAAAAAPDATIKGFDGDASRPASIGAGGTIVGHPGDPGEPEVDLNPLTYHWRHEIELEFAAAPSATDPAAALDAMMQAFGAAVAADRTLSGLVDWLETGGAMEDDQLMAGAATTRWASVTVVAHYSTLNPLGD